MSANSDATRDPASHLAEVADSWQPGHERTTSAIDALPVQALAAALDVDPEPIIAAGTLPAFWHWLYFLSWPRQADLGVDGHPRTGPLLPPIAGRRRMFAGGRLTVHQPLTLGQPAQRSASVTSAQFKLGRTGEQLFVTVRAEVHQGGELAIVDEQDLVYRSDEGAPAAPSPSRAADPPAPPPPAEAETETDAWRSEPFSLDSRLLFRFSALTANTHRIHYDEPYVTAVEGFDGLVVQGPLQAILLAEALRTRYPSRRLHSMTYRLLRPTIAGRDLVISEVAAPGTDAAVALQIRSTGGLVHARAAAELDA